MPQDTTIVESAKQRSLRVPLDHYARPSRLAGAKWWLSGALGMAAAIYVGWLLSGGFAAQRSVSPGPVASVHATWNNDCQACHQNFQPLRADAVNLAAAFSSNTSRDLADAACLKCHNEPPHHANEKPGEVPSCAACHREHQGSAANIVRPDDHRCLNCHLNIDQHRNGPSGLTPVTRNVTGFAPAQPGQTPHPDFRSLADDPGNIKFNHWLHLQPGIAVRDAKHKLRYRDLPRSQLLKSASNAGSDDLVQLDCSACHQPAADQGSYMQPILFEQHCQACHPLELKTAESLQPVKVPHGLSASQLSTTIDGLLFAAEQRRSASVALLPDESGDLPLIPGKTLGRNLAQKIGADLLAHRTTALQTIDAKCQQCHYPDQDANREKADVHELKPASIPSIWLKHARFDHTAHRHVECRQCHSQAFAFEQRDKPQFVVPPTGGAAALDDSQVMIVGLESCASCHAPASGVRGGARHDCAECHNYHADSSIGQAASLPGLKVSELAWFPGSTLSTHIREASAAPAT